MSNFFGTDGIRGEVGKAPITADFLLKVGWAVGSVLRESGSASVIIGKDTRVSGYLFESAKKGATIGLLSAQGKESFYGHYGYTQRPNELLGHGMCKFI